MPPIANPLHDPPSKRAAQKRTTQTERVSDRETALPVVRRTLAQAASEILSQEILPGRRELLRGSSGIEIVRQLEKLHDDSGCNTPDVPAVHVKMITWLAAGRELSIANKIGLRHQ